VRVSTLSPEFLLSAESGNEETCKPRRRVPLSRHVGYGVRHDWLISMRAVTASDAPREELVCIVEATAKSGRIAVHLDPSTNVVSGSPIGSSIAPVQFL